MQIDGEKLLEMLNENRKTFCKLKESSSNREGYDDALMNHAAECTIENIIEAVRSGKYNVVKESGDV